MLPSDVIEQLAAELHASERSRVQVEHFSKRFPGMTVEDGYAISRAWVRTKLAEGRTVKGHKIGLTSRAMQIASQIDEPDYGTLLDDMFFAPGEIPTERFIAPRVEVELAFILKSRLEGEAVTVDDVLAATEYVQPAIEIIDARIEQFDRHTRVMRKVFDTISDNAANAGIVLGGERVRPGEVDLPWCGAILRQNGAVEETGLAAGVQGHPAIGVAWLARKLAPWGEALLPGQVVLAGSFTRPVAAKRGDAFDADYGRLGRFQFNFV
ncbi:MAG: 2-oxo-hepta-3-ene-1,7-dioic acid hydratase [Rhodocyclaceae bacterium]|nr:2-oxo-hepta-3-ene-1,7-dioic acid hydratase [Pseudomonadota bacterium]MDQ7975236.1 2-oxo-hepta-3-ene-1,7-dioic acid hydratase [Rhodocyclaceae bacterium]MDQ8001671.1 2-oxo-hepta-3-ene-1,7-dioic acid hydratase [Pseudomonadota bacterium]